MPTSLIKECQKLEFNSELLLREKAISPLFLSEAPLMRKCLYIHRTGEVKGFAFIPSLEY
jgi:hypothetical protein